MAQDYYAGFQLPQAARRDGGWCPVKYPGVGLWSKMPGRPKLEDHVVWMFPCHSLPCTVIYFCFQKVVVNQRSKGFSLPFSDTKDLQYSRTIACSVQQYLLCKKQRVEQELFLGMFVTVIFKSSSSKVSEKKGICRASGTAHTHTLMFPSDLEVIPFSLEQCPFWSSALKSRVPIIKLPNFGTFNNKPQTQIFLTFAFACQYFIPQIVVII